MTFMPDPPPPGTEKEKGFLWRLLIFLLAALVGVWLLNRRSTTPPGLPSPADTALACDLLKRHNTLPLLGGAAHLHRLPQPVPWRAAQGLQRDALAVTRQITRATGIRFKPWPQQALLPHQGIVFTFGQAKNADGSPGCGQALDFQKFGLTRLLVPARPAATCPERRLILLHETIHALGFAGHTAGDTPSILHRQDRFWPSRKDWEKPAVDAPLKLALRLLYQQPDGTPLKRVCRQ